MAKFSSMVGIFFLILVTQAWAESDPTKPLAWMQPQQQKKVVTKPLPKLDSIICTTQCSAVIGGEVVSSGDDIDGYRVRQIESSKVVIARGKQQWTLELYSQDIKQ